jgi:hypothetical protein
MAAGPCSPLQSGGASWDRAIALVHGYQQWRHFPAISCLIVGTGVIHTTGLPVVRAVRKGGDGRPTLGLCPQEAAPCRGPRTRCGGGPCP